MKEAGSKLNYRYDQHDTSTIKPIIERLRSFFEDGLENPRIVVQSGAGTESSYCLNLPSGTISTISEARDFRAADPEVKQVFTDGFEKNFRQLFNYLNKILDNPSIAEDLASETIIKALESLGNYTSREGIPLTSWLFRIAINLMKDQQKRRREESLSYTPPGKLSLEEQLVSFDKTPDEQSLVNLIGEDVQSALSSLSSNQRDVIVLELMGYTKSSEIGRILQKPPGAVRALKLRARLSLKSELGKRMS